MKENIYYLFLPLIFLFSCSTFHNQKDEQKKYYQFNKQKKDIKIIEYELISDTFNYKKDKRQLYKTECIYYNDISFLIVNGERFTNNIIVFDPNKGEKKCINFDKIGYKSFIDFGYINSDSIFLVYHGNDDNGYHDSLLFLGNSSGEITKVYSLKDAPVRSRENSQTFNREKHVSMFPNWDEPFTYRDNKLFIHFSAKAKNLGDPVVENTIIAGYIDTKTNKFHSINVKYPNIEFGKQFFPNSDKRFFSIFAHDGDLLYAFKYTPTIIKYNYKTGKSTKFQIKSSVFDTIYPSLSEAEVPKGHDFILPYPKYYVLQYDPYRKLYYRFVLLPKEYGKGNYMVIVADTSFNVVAEGFTYRKNNQFNFTFTKDYLFDYNKCYKMKFRDGTNMELISKVKSEKLKQKHIDKPLTHYVKHFAKIKDRNYTALFMWQNVTCKKSSNFFFNLMQTNEEKYKKYGVYLFIIADDINKLKEELRKYNLSPNNHINIIIDSTFEYGAYNNYNAHSLPRTIKVRNNKIVTDTIFSFEDGGAEFQKFIISSGKEQKALLEK